MNIDEKLVQDIIRETKEHLGAAASENNIKKVVKETLRYLQNNNRGYVHETHSDFKYLDKTEGRMIVTAFGVNKPGIIFSISKVLAECECNIMDVSQKIMQDFFTLIMVVDIATAICPFGTIKDNLDEASARIGIRIIAQHEEVFRSMHRV